MSKLKQHPGSKAFKDQNIAMLKELLAVADDEQKFIDLGLKGTEKLEAQEAEHKDSDGIMQVTKEDGAIAFGLMWDVEVKAEWIKTPTVTREEYIAAEILDCDEHGLICESYE